MRRMANRAFLLACVISLLFPDRAMATWESPLRVIADSLRGSVATSVSVIALVVACFLLMTQDMPRGTQRIFFVVIAFSIISSVYGLLSLFGVISSLA